MPTQPNILWIMTDQHNFQALSAVGSLPVRTPNIDRIAAAGVRFDTAYCPSPVCGPCRVSLFTGLYPSEHDVRKNWLCHDHHLPELPDLLARAGYHTAQVGKLHLEPAAAPHGFQWRRHHDSGYSVYYPEEPWQSDYMHWLADTFFDGDMVGLIDRFDADEDAFGSDPLRFINGRNWRTEAQHSNTWVADCSIEFLREARDPDRPFFLYASYFGPHQPMAAPAPWDKRFDPDEIPLPPEYHTPTEDKPIVQDRAANNRFCQTFATLSERQVRECLAAYYGQVEMIDHNIGRMLDELDRQGLADNTIILFTADHGDHAGQFGWLFKGTMYAGSAQVPLILADPARAESAGAVCPRSVSNMDLLATLLARAQAEPPAIMHSNDLAPLLADPQAEWDKPVFSEFHMGPEVYYLAALGDWKLIRYRREDGSALHELYNTREGLDAVNLYEDPAQADRRNALSALLDEHETLQRVGQPAR